MGDMPIRQEDIFEVIPGKSGYDNIQIKLIPGEDEDEDVTTEIFLTTDAEGVMQTAMQILWPSLAPSQPSEEASGLSQSSTKSTGRSRVSIVATAIKLNPDKAVTPKLSVSTSTKKTAPGSGRYTPINIVSTPTPNRSKKKKSVAASPKSSSVSLSYGGHAEASNSDDSDNNDDDANAMQIETQAFDGAHSAVKQMATVQESETVELVPESLDIPDDILATKRRNTSFELSSSEEDVSEYHPSQKLSATKPKAKAKSRAKSRAKASANVSDDTDSDLEEKMTDAGSRGSRSTAKSKAKAKTKAKSKPRKPVIDDLASGESDDEQSNDQMQDDDDDFAAAAEAAEAAEVAKAKAAKRNKDAAAAKRKEAAAAKRKAAAAEKKAAAEDAAEAAAEEKAAKEKVAAEKKAVAKKKAADAKLKAKEDAAAAAAAAVIIAARKAKAKSKPKARPAARSVDSSPTAGKSKASMPRKTVRSRAAVVDDSDDSIGPSPYRMTPRPASRARRDPTPSDSADSEIDQCELEDNVPYHRRGGTPTRSKTATKPSRNPATPIPKIPKSTTEQPSRSRKAAGTTHPGDMVPSRKRAKMQASSSDESPIKAAAPLEQFSEEFGMDMFEKLAAQKARAATAPPDNSVKEIMRDGGDSMINEVMELVKSQNEDRTSLDSRHDTDSAALNAKIAQVKTSYDGFQARFSKLSEAAEKSSAKIIEVDQSLLQLFKSNATVVDGSTDSGDMELDEVKGSIQAKVKKIVGQLHQPKKKKQNNQTLQMLLQCMQ